VDVLAPQEAEEGAAAGLLEAPPRAG